MQIVKSRSATAQPSMVNGPTMVLINRDTVVETVKDEDGTTRQEYVCTQYRMDLGEYGLVRAGILPEGATWDAELRRIERSALLDNADIRIAEAEDHIAAGEAEEAEVKALREYKMAVRATVNQSGFPTEVAYPSMP